ncbi:uncharacterized protein VP01_10188g1, partial [Puccinia sorghi]
NGESRSIPDPVIPAELSQEEKTDKPIKILDKKLTRIEGKAYDDKWLAKEKIQNADILLRRFRAVRKGSVMIL